MTDAAAWRARLDTLRERHGVVGAQFGLIDATGTRVTVASGVRDSSRGDAVSEHTLFQIGSITKLFTTVLVMQLVTEGALSLDAPVRDTLPDFALADPDAAAAVTVRMLLSHTSGIAGDVFDDTGSEGNAIARYVRALQQVRQVHRPGERFSYCNAGFVVAGRIVEVLRATTWNAAVRERIIEPLGLARTFAGPDEIAGGEAGDGGAGDGGAGGAAASGSARAATADGAGAGGAAASGGAAGAGAGGAAASGGTAVAGADDIARGHTGSGADAAAVPPSVGRLPRALGPAGLVVSNADNLLTFADLLRDPEATPGGGSVIDAASATAMRVPQIDVRECQVTCTGWGLGTMLDEWGGEQVFGHDGATIGQRAYLRILPRQGTAAVLLTSGGRADGLAHDMFADVAADAGLTIRPALSAAGDAPQVAARAYGFDDAGAVVTTGPNGPRLTIIDPSPTGGAPERSTVDLRASDVAGVCAWTSPDLAGWAQFRPVAGGAYVGMRFLPEQDDG